MRTFGNRWMAEGEIKNIRQWESKNTLDSTLSSNYGSCLEFFIQNELVYASSWTSYGNPREYTLFPSLQNLLFNCSQEIMEELQKVTDVYHFDLPFWVLRSLVSRRLTWCWASYLVSFLCHKEIANISVLYSASTHIELIERNNVLREVVSNIIIRAKLTVGLFPMPADKWPEHTAFRRACRI